MDFEMGCTKDYEVIWFNGVDKNFDATIEPNEATEIKEIMRPHTHEPIGMAWGCTPTAGNRSSWGRRRNGGSQVKLLVRGGAAAAAPDAMVTPSLPAWHSKLWDCTPYS